MENDYVIENKREGALHPADQRYAGTDTTLFYFYFTGTGTVRELVCQPLDETEGAQPRIRLMGLFIELSGLDGCRRGMCQREEKCIIDHSLFRYVVLFLPNTEQRR